MSGSAAGERAFRWWVMECDFPRLSWCRTRVLADGSWEVVDGEGGLHRFLDGAAARAWLTDEEYVPFDEDSKADLVAAGVSSGDLAEPAPEACSPRVDTTAVCGSCGADWEQGHHTSGCVECGGGAMLRACPMCAGDCGAVFARAVLDSIDFHEAHWIGSCRRAP